MTKSQRQLQIGENIKRNISEIFLREDIIAVPGVHITILEADVSPDAKNVKIYINIFGNDKIHDQMVKQLNEAAPFFRRELGKRLFSKSIPQIKFILDKTADEASKIEALINQESKKFDKD